MRVYFSLFIHLPSLSSVSINFLTLTFCNHIVQNPERPLEHTEILLLLSLQRIAMMNDAQGLSEQRKNQMVNIAALFIYCTTVGSHTFSTIYAFTNILTRYRFTYSFLEGGMRLGTRWGVLPKCWHYVCLYYLQAPTQLCGFWHINKL